jgi:DNA transposition AAA+ family ATPase
MKSIYTTTVRLNLNEDDDRRAWEYLRRLDKKKYRSFSKAVVMAVNDYFGRLERLDTDPYLETREKEDAFLQEIREAVRKGLQQSAPANLGTILQLMQGVQPLAASGQDADNESLDAAMDFMDSF